MILMNKASDKEIVELNKAITHVSNLLGAKDKGLSELSQILEVMEGKKFLIYIFIYLLEKK